MRLLGPTVSYSPHEGRQKLTTLSFNILITGGTSGLVETITDAVSVHSIKKAEYARMLAEGTFRHITLLDHFKSVSFSRVKLIYPLQLVPSDIRGHFVGQVRQSSKKFCQVVSW